jgi:hypothetical protein
MSYFSEREFQTFLAGEVDRLLLPGSRSRGGHFSTRRVPAVYLNPRHLPILAFLAAYKSGDYVTRYQWALRVRIPPGPPLFSLTF